MKSFCWIFIFLFFSGSVFSQTSSQSSSEVEGQRKLHYSVSLGLGYQSLILYEQHNRAMESFLTIDAKAVYYPLSFLSLSYCLGVGAFSYYNIGGLPSSVQVYFPTSVNRFNVENTLSVEFYGLMNSSSLMYLGIGGSYIYMGNLNREDAIDPSGNYPNTERHIFSLHISLGSRFALYNHTVMEAELYVMLPFNKTRSWLHTGPQIYNQLILGFMMNIGFFD